MRTPSYMGLMAALVVGLLAAAGYAGTLDGEPFFDDHRLLEHCAPGQEVVLPWDATGFRPWRPAREITDLSFSFTCSTWGPLPRAHCGWNIALHVLNTILLYLLLLRLLRRQHSIQEEVISAACLGASLFAVHPLAAMCVNYISQRYTLMATAFVLLGVTLATWRGVWAAVASAFSLFLGIHCKEIAVVGIPLAILARRSCRPEQRQSRVWPALAGVVMMLGLVALIPRVVQVADLPGWLSGEDALGAEARNIRQGLAAVSLELRTAFWPDLAWLSIDHDDHQLASVPGWLLLVMVMASGWASHLAWRRRWHFVFLGVAWWWWAWLPYVVLPMTEIWVDYKAYLPLAGLVLLLMEPVSRALRRPVIFQATAVIAFLVVVLSWNQLRETNLLFESPLSLWRDAASKAPTKPRTLNNLGVELIIKGQWKEARLIMEKTVTLRPDYAQAWGNLGMCQDEQGESDGALNSFNRALELDPSLQTALFGAARVLMRQAHPDRACLHLDRLIAENPRHMGGWTQRVFCLRAVGQLERASQALAQIEARDVGAARFAREVLQRSFDLVGPCVPRAITPEEAWPFFMAEQEFLTGKTQAGLAQLERVTDSHPAVSEARLREAQIRYLSGHADALSHLQAALNTCPGHPEGLELLRTFQGPNRRHLTDDE